MLRVRKAIIPAAGLGTRFLPATKAQPKEMLPIVDKPTIQYIIEEAIESGIEDVLIVTGRSKRAIEDHFDHSVELEESLARSGKEDLLKLAKDISMMVDIHYVRQKEPRGLGHAVWCARKFIGNEPFAVLLGDDIIASKRPGLRQLMDLHQEVGGSVIGVQEVPWEETRKYGVLDVGQRGNGPMRIRGLAEKPQSNPPSNLAVMGRYIIDPKIFDLLEKQGPGSGGEIQLTDALNTLAQTDPVYGLAFEGIRYDVGDKLGWLKANIDFALGRADLSGPFRQILEETVDLLREVAADQEKP